jgi:hypothetical protein
VSRLGLIEFAQQEVITPNRAGARGERRDARTRKLRLKPNDDQAFPQLTQGEVVELAGFKPTAFSLIRGALRVPTSGARCHLAGQTQSRMMRKANWKRP